MGVCGIYGCYTNSKNFKKKGLHLFHLPKNKKIAEQWLHFCKMKDKVNIKHAYICSSHFSDDDFNNLLEHQMMGTKLHLKPNAVPSINLPSIKCSQIAAKRQKINESVQIRPAQTETNAKDSTQGAAKKQKVNESVQTSPTHTKTDAKYVTALKNSDLYNLVKIQIQVCSVPAKSREQELENENKHLKKEVMQLSHQLQLFKKMFTPGQIIQILKPNSLTHWEQNDITAAIELKSMSSKCYNYLREVRKFPLPSVGTLNHWVKELGVDDHLSLYKTLKASTSDNDDTINEAKATDEDSTILKMLLTKKKIVNA